MEVLPIKSIREEDLPLIGTDLYNLTKLAWADFPVAEGIVALPPQVKIKTLLEHIRFKQGEIFEQRLTLLNSQIRKIPVPEDLEKALKHRQIDTQKLWRRLLEFWIEELRQEILRDGFSPHLAAHLSSQPVFFTGRITASGICFFNRGLNMVVIETELGNLDDGQKNQLEELVKKADKKLLLPQVYSWVVEKNIEIIKTSPLTNAPILEEMEGIIPDEVLAQTKHKSAVKVFLQTDQSFRTELEADGAIIASDTNPDFDRKILQLTDSAQTLAGKPVIFKLTDNPEGQVRGALQLIHRPNLLRADVEAVKFARHKKHHANVGVCIPLVRSPEELARMKMELSGLGITRQGNLKLWVELSVPENFLNLDEYLDQGIDGVLINLDGLSVRVGGFDPEAEEGIFYAKQVKAVLKLLEPGLKLLHKEKIPAVAAGTLAIHDDVLDFLVGKGIYGISVDFANFLSIHERLRLVEKRVIKLSDNQHPHTAGY